jgi:hypothetical protein
VTGPEHYRKAEELLEEAESSGAAWPAEKAQVHATLALAAATALHGVIDHRHWFEAMETPRSGD